MLSTFSKLGKLPELRKLNKLNELNKFKLGLWALGGKGIPPPPSNKIMNGRVHIETQRIRSRFGSRFVLVQPHHDLVSFHERSEEEEVAIG